jgi:Terpene synthase family 2, C-terminal metal binding
VTASHIAPRADFPEIKPETAAAVFFLANKLQREATAWSAAYDDIATLALTFPIALSHAFVSPWRRPDELRASNRMGNWLLWLDDVIERADSDAQADDLAEGCRAVAAGEQPSTDHSLIRALGDIHDELAATPLWPVLATRWQERVTRTAAGHRRHRDFSRALADGTPPSPAEYMSITSGVELARITHLIAAEGLDVVDHIELLLQAIEAQDRAHRLVNDIQTFDRDRRDGDINVLFLGVTRQEAADQAEDYAARAHSLLHPLVAAHVRAAIEVDRQTSLTIAFYQAMDYRA